MQTNIADYFFMFSTMGEMALKDVIGECQEQAWAPIVIIRPHASPNDVIIPCFNTRENAIKFGKRNFPKNQLFGTVVLPEDSFNNLHEKWVKNKGWKMEPMDHPRLVKHIGKIDVEVYEFLDKPDVFGLKGKRADVSKSISYAL